MSQEVHRKVSRKRTRITLAEQWEKRWISSEDSVPQVTVPQVTVPQVTVPQVTVPQVTVPQDSVSQVTDHCQPISPSPVFGLRRAVSSASGMQENSDWFANSFNNAQPKLPISGGTEGVVECQKPVQRPSDSLEHSVMHNNTFTGLNTPKREHKAYVRDIYLSPGLNQSDSELLTALDVVETNIQSQASTQNTADQPVISDCNETGANVLDNSTEHLCSASQNIVTETMSVETISDELAEEILKSPETPVSLADKLRRRLQANGKMPTPKSNRLQSIRDQEIHKAMEFVKEVTKDVGSEFDMGPFYGLPSRVQSLLKELRGISKVYDWQHECLSLQPVREGHNLIYTLPTSGGKTLVAEILIMRELLCKKKDALLILPFVAIVQEKVRTLVEFASELDFLVEEYAGSKGVIPPKRRMKRQTLYIATIEKACSLVNSLIEEERIGSLGLVVVDELHMLGEGGRRGAILEETLTKLMVVHNNVQILGMSATLSNISDVQEFLKAQLYSNDFRPVELKEYIKLNDTLYSVDSSAKCPEDVIKHSRTTTFPYTKALRSADPDHIIGLVSEVIPHNSCLVFCQTKKNCENVAIMICKNMPRHLMDIRKDERRALIKQLIEEGNGQICEVLKKTIQYGVAYHHSGLTADERKVIEESYSSGILCLLTCTSTLAAGVNLPAKRVILRSAYVGSEFISYSQYKQMTGRAGRAGIDTSGDSILIVKNTDREKVRDLVSGPCGKCTSSLYYEGGKGIRALLLSCVGLKIAATVDDIQRFMLSSLASLQSSLLQLNLNEVAQDALNKLFELKLIKRDVCGSMSATELGRAAFKGGVDVDRAPQLYRDLCQAQQSLVLANYLHLVYLVTPYDMAEQINPDWMIYCQQLGKLKSDELKVAELIGVPESLIVRKASGQRVTQVYSALAVQRFYLSLMVYQLWQQKSIWHISQQFHVTRGYLQSLLQSAATCASCVSRFCQELSEFWAYKDLFGNFVKRLSYCVMAELVPLMELPGIKQARARQLYNAGYKTVQLIAQANPEELVKAILISHKMAHQIVVSAQLMIKEAAESLREEADILTAPLIPQLIAVNSPSQVDSQVSTVESVGFSQEEDGQYLFT